MSRVAAGIGAVVAFWLIVASVWLTRGVILVVPLVVMVSIFAYWFGESLARRGR